jgi:DNA repair exonuclease SbcCD ATPase subunit
MNLSDEIQKRVNVYNQKLALKQQILEDITKYQSRLYFLDKEIEECDKAVIMLTNISLEAKRSITMFLEDLVTDALQYISQGQYTFKIDIDEKKCEFYIVETVDGVESKQRPQDSCGGGFIDIISTTLRYAYLNLYNNPELMGPIILDEPGKMVSADMSIRFGEFIKKLGEEFERQTIMITHNDNLTNIADNCIEIIKE